MTLVVLLADYRCFHGVVKIKRIWRNIQPLIFLPPAETCRQIHLVATILQDAFSTRKCTRDLGSGCLKKIKGEARDRKSHDSRQAEGPLKLTGVSFLSEVSENGYPVCTADVEGDDTVPRRNSRRPVERKTDFVLSPERVDAMRRLIGARMHNARHA